LVNKNIPSSTLNSAEPKYVLRDIDQLQENSYEENAIIIDKNQSNETLDKIILSLNTYLKKNKNTATEFNVFKDTVERNCDTQDESIGILLPVTLYLGLLGTITGIIFGLLSMSFADTTEFLEGDTIPHFLQGVMVAMTASGTGLFLTIINTSWSYKKAKVELEKGKNEFYDFVQSSLMPVSSQNIASSINNLQTNLSAFSDKFITNIHSFNESFETNLKSLGETLNKNHDAIRIQQDVLKRLEKIDIVELAKVNIKTFRELQKSATQFEQFVVYMEKLNKFIGNTEQLTKQVHSLYDRFEKVEKNTGHIVEKIFNQINEGKTLMQFIKSHFGELEKNRALIDHAVGENNKSVKKIITINNEFWNKILADNNQNMTEAVIDLNNKLEKSLEQLQSVTQKKIEAIQQIAVQENIRLEQSVKQNTGNLGKLSYLEDIYKDNSEYNKTSKNQQFEISALLKKLNQNIEKQMNGKSKKSVWDRVNKQIKIYKK